MRAYSSQFRVPTAGGDAQQTTKDEAVNVPSPSSDNSTNYRMNILEFKCFKGKLNILEAPGSSKQNYVDKNDNPTSPGKLFDVFLDVNQNSYCFFFLHFFEAYFLSSLLDDGINCLKRFVVRLSSFSSKCI